MNESKNPSAMRSKQQIINALLHLMEQYPYNEITVKQIIFETDLVRKTSEFYIQRRCTECLHQSED